MITTEPPAAALAWAASVAGPSATIRAVRVLGGGMHAATHLIETADPETSMVMRRFELGDTAAADEVRVLSALDGLGGFAPRLLAGDPDGERFGEAATLISLVPGTGNILPADTADWARQLAVALSRVHAVPRERVEGFPEWMLTRRPTSALITERWADMNAQPLVLTHGDFWSGNTVWVGDTLSAVVDWPHASLAPRGYDVGWCRNDLVLQHGEELADVFLAAYEEAAGVSVPDVYLWDLWHAERSAKDVHTWSKGYVDFGRPDMTGDELRARHTAWMKRLLEQQG